MKPSATATNEPAPPSGCAEVSCVGSDRFGRVFDQRWIDHTSGDLNLAAIGTEAAGEAFDYDPSGNCPRSARTLPNPDSSSGIRREGLPAASAQWREFRAWTGGAELVQPRTHNQANELVWDAWSRLAVVQRKVDGEVVSTHRYQHDGLFRRTRALEIGGAKETRDFYYDSSWKVIEERVQSPLGDHTDLFVYGIRGRNDLVFRDRIEGGTTTRHYALSDAMGSITAITNDDGEVVERYAYSAFGMSRVMDADFEPLATSAHDWQVRFHGESRDAATGWYNYGYRFYLPELGRWPSRDSIGEDGGMNLYGFVENSPPNRIDVFGNFGIEKIRTGLQGWLSKADSTVVITMKATYCCPRDVIPEGYTSDDSNDDLSKTNIIEDKDYDGPKPIEDGKIYKISGYATGRGEGEATVYHTFTYLKFAEDFIEFDHNFLNISLAKFAAEKLAIIKARKNAVDNAFNIGASNVDWQCHILFKKTKILAATDKVKTEFTGKQLN